MNQFLSSDDNGEESDVGSTDDGLPCPIKFVAKDKKEKFAKSGREADRRKLRNLCEVGKALSSQLLTTEDILPRTDSRNKLWSNESNLKSSLVDVSLETSLVCFTEICYLQTFKIMTDWLRYAGDNIGIFRRVILLIFSYFVEFLFNKSQIKIRKFHSLLHFSMKMAPSLYLSSFRIYRVCGRKLLRH